MIESASLTANPISAPNAARARRTTAAATGTVSPGVAGVERAHQQLPRRRKESRRRRTCSRRCEAWQLQPLVAAPRLFVPPWTQSRRHFVTTLAPGLPSPRNRLGSLCRRTGGGDRNLGGFLRCRRLSSRGACGSTVVARPVSFAFSSLERESRRAGALDLNLGRCCHSGHGSLPRKRPCHCFFCITGLDFHPGLGCVRPAIRPCFAAPEETAMSARDSSFPRVRAVEARIVACLRYGLG